VRPGLLHPTADLAFDAPAPLAAHGVDRDLALGVLIDAMAGGDGTIADAARRVLLDPLTDPDAIAHRQGVWRATLARPELARALYAIAVRTLERRRKVYWGHVRRPDAVVYQGMELLHLYLGAFRELRGVADGVADTAPDAAADGLAALLARLRRELDDPFLDEVAGHLKSLRFQAGVRVSARLGRGHAGTGYVLERPEAAPRGALGGWWRALRRRRTSSATYRLPPHDDSGARALAEIQGRGLARTADAVGAACDDLLWFFRQLRDELAFYVGAVALHERLAALGAPTTLPEAAPAGVLRAEGLYDAGLALTVGRPVVANDLRADGADLIVVTGANQGGKTTFLRSVGSAQLLLQAGLFVPATSFRAAVAPGVFTHFTREEDAGMRRGRLEDELARLSDLVSVLRPGALLLLNESFASTNDREGSELAAGVVGALTEAGVRLLFVTHLTQFAAELHAERRDGALFLRAERLADGVRTFRMVAGAPQRGSHGGDLYRALFDADGVVVGVGEPGA